jgi:hypothetical protein
MLLSAEDIKRALEALAQELRQTNTNAEMVIVGGAALVLLFNARESTKDVDVFFVRPDAATVRVAAEHVAENLSLPNDWLNDGAKGYLVGLTKGDLLHKSESLTVYAASLPQLLAMKLSAWRDAVDRDDAKLLLQKMDGDREQIWAALEPFVTRHLLDKASYAFEDLWEALYGHS